VPVASAPIYLTILPRTKKEMDDYIGGLTNRVAACLGLQKAEGSFRKGGVVPVDSLPELLVKLMYTCRPEIVPILLESLYEFDSGGDWEQEAILYYVPHTEETRRTISEAVALHGLNKNMEELLEHRIFNGEEVRPLTDDEMKPIITRALAADNKGQWHFGAELAARSCYDDAFTPRLIAIATANGSDGSASQNAAIDALAWNRTDAGVKTLKTLLNDPDLGVSSQLAFAIGLGCQSEHFSPAGRHLQPTDFTVKEMAPLIARLQASDTDAFAGRFLTEHFSDDALTPEMVALATDPTSKSREDAIYALAANRTDDGVKTLRTLLIDPNPEISAVADRAIRRAYANAREERESSACGSPSRAPGGTPLRPDDFDAKFQVPDPKR